MRISDWSSDVCSSDLVTIAKDADAGQAGKMPLYVTESGYEEFEDTHTRVGRNAPLPHTLWLVDMASGEPRELDLSALPGIGEDPLAELRAAARQAPLKGDRPVRVETDGDGTGPAIHWTGDSPNVALLPPPTHNKDHKITPVHN